MKQIITIILSILLGFCIGALVFDKQVCPNVRVVEAQQPDCINNCEVKECPEPLNDCVDQLRKLERNAVIAVQVFESTKKDLSEVLDITRR